MISRVQAVQGPYLVRNRVRELANRASTGRSYQHCDRIVPENERNHRLLGKKVLDEVRRRLIEQDIDPVNIKRTRFSSLFPTKRPH